LSAAGTSLAAFPFFEENSMAKTRIAVIVGSLRRESFNRKLADALPGLAPDVEFTQLRIADLPPYNQDDDGRPAESVKRLKDEIAAVDGLIFVTPEYNRSLPGVLKNAIDHASRPYGQNAWKGKPAGVLGVSIGAAGTAMAQQHLRNVLAYLDVPTLGQPEVFIQTKDGVFDAPGKLGDATAKFMHGWMRAYLAFVQRHLG
jgi:chromate reductase, NAD(P)H dehydrogenase (quinone)